MDGYTKVTRDITKQSAFEHLREALSGGRSETLLGRYLGEISERTGLREDGGAHYRQGRNGSLAACQRDFNNLLTAITGYASLLLEMAEQGDPKREALEEIQRAGEKAASLTNQLLVFSRQQVTTLKVMDLNRLVTEMERLLQRLIGDDLNLCVNARDAMPQGGKLIIRTAGSELRAVEEANGRPREALKPGRYVTLSISDMGVGMTEEIRSRLFEPFFTTKEPGKGTGLGLSMVFGIVQQAGGRIGERRCRPPSIGVAGARPRSVPDRSGDGGNERKPIGGSGRQGQAWNQNRLHAFSPIRLLQKLRETLGKRKISRV